MADKANTSTDEPVFSVDDFFTTVRYGKVSHVKFILDKMGSDYANKLDSRGFTPMHWAAKRGDPTVMQTLLDAGAKLSTPSSFETSMLPIHFAASDGMLKSIKFLLDNREDINALDANACTPLTVAAQFGQVQTVIYLIKNGADVTHTDINGDTALHWGAYKGLQELVGLLLYYNPHQLNKADVYGQTPLHLAAMRGHADTVHFLILEHKADFNLRDQNGLTPLDLAMKKEQLRAEWTIRRLTTINMLDLLFKLGLSRLKNTNVLEYVLWGYSETETTRWTWRMTCSANIIACFCGVYFAMSTVLADLYILHAVNSVVMCLWWILFITCSWMKPVYVEEGSPERHTVRGSGNAKSRSLELSSESQEGAPSDLHPRSYEAALALMGSDAALDGRNLPSVCHSCGLQRPLRAKHCKFMRKCVVKYDHFCPYVYACVSRDSYKYYVCMLVTHMAAYTLFMLAASIYWYRAGVSYIFMGYIVYSTGMAVMIAILVAYHTKLITCNLTTNEDVNSFKYDYMRDDDGKFNNVFDLHNRWDNTLDGLFPSKKLYYTRQEVLWDRHSRNDIDCRGGNSKAERIDEKVVYSANGVTALTGGATATTFGDDHNLHHRDNNRTNQR